MKKSEFKKLVKFVLTEIYSNPLPDENWDDETEETEVYQKMVGEFESALQKLMSSPEVEHINDPAYIDLIEGTKLVSRTIARFYKIISQIISSAYEKNKPTYKKAFQMFRIEESFLLYVISYWAKNISVHSSKNAKEEMVGILGELKTHLEEIVNQTNRIIQSLTVTNTLSQYNIINAQNQTKHLEEIFEALRQSAIELFKLGAKYNYAPPTERNK
jgi:hypothetical protein